jgi:Pentapeptide repeats (8 copies)
VSRADLTDAYLQEANPRWAKLFAADLQAANLFAAELQHANLHGGIPAGSNDLPRESGGAPGRGGTRGALPCPGSARRRLGSGRGPSGRSTSATGAMAGGGCTLSLATLHQLLGYLLLDYDDAYQIDALGVSTCASRSHGVRGAQRSPGDWLYLTHRAVGGRQPAHRALDPNRGRRGDSSGPRPRLAQS